MLLLNKETIIQDIIQDMMSRNERANALLNESGHESGQTVPIGNTGNLDAIASRGTTKQLLDKV
jgi:hypothetical protein